MGTMEGRASAEIRAEIAHCYAIAADIDRIHEWQAGIERTQVLERDHEGRALLVEIVNDAKVTTIKTKVRFDHEPPHRLSWRQEKGDLKSLFGSWTFETGASGITHATYALEGDPGRMLGMLVRGPVEARLLDLLIHGRPHELRARAENG